MTFGQQLTYYVIRPVLASGAPSPVFVPDARDELYLSPHVRLCGVMAMACLEDEALAQRFAEACAPHLQRRYGAATALEVSSVTGVAEKRTLRRVSRDSAIARRRLESGNFVPNMPTGSEAPAGRD